MMKLYLPAIILHLPLIENLDHKDVLSYVLRVFQRVTHHICVKT